VKPPIYLTGLQRQAAILQTLRYEGYRRLSWRQLLRMNRLLASEKLVEHGGMHVFNSFLPPFPSRAFESLANGVADLARSVSAPVSAYLAVTDACRYRCAHCSKAGRKGEPLGFDDWAQVVAETQDRGVAIVGFTGGEPLLFGRLEELIARVDDRSVSLLFTTGDGLTAARARSLADAGLFGAAVSLDSFDEAEHDAGRGAPGAFRAAVAAIGNLREAGLYAMAQVMATRKRCDPAWLKRYLAFVRSLGVEEVRLLEPMPCGRLLDGHDMWRISDEQRERLKRLHFETNRDRTTPKVSSFAFIEDVSRYGCGAGFQHFYVDALGNVQPCDFTPVSFGNVRREPLAAILGRMQEAFARPRGTCFMLENGAKLAACPCKETPIPSEEAARYVDFSATGPLPAFYRALGWKPPLSSAP
jgi:radical SAM protein with 4Fe4S-binding SPASM domain